METKKTIHDMEVREILRQQLELLAEASKAATSTLPELTQAMCLLIPELRRWP